MGASFGGEETPPLSYQKKKKNPTRVLPRVGQLSEVRENT